MELALRRKINENKEFQKQKLIQKFKNKYRKQN